MKVFYWIVFGVGVLFAAGTLISFSIGIAFDNQIWLQRARRMRHWLWLVILFVFNFSVWGSVVNTLVHWHTG